MSATVQALAERVGMTVLAFKEYPDKIVIVFVEGPKMTFDRDDAPAPKTEPETVKPARAIRAKAKPKK